MEKGIKTEYRQIRGFGEMCFVIGTVFIAIGVTLMTKGNLGISMVVSPAYLISLKVAPISFGMADYLLQGVLLTALWIVMRRFNWKDVFSFVAAFAYGVTLDVIILLTEGLEPNGMGGRILCFASGMLINALGVSFFFRTYLPLQVYELFVKGLSDHFHKPLTKVKMTFDCCCVTTAIVMSLLFFGELRGIGVGTVLCAICNGPLIGFFGKYIDRYFEASPRIGPLYGFFANGGNEDV